MDIVRLSITPKQYICLFLDIEAGLKPTINLKVSTLKFIHTLCIHIYHNYVTLNAKIKISLATAYVMTKTYILRGIW